MKPLTEQTKISPAKPENANPIVIEESAPEGALEEVTIPSTEDEVQVITPPLLMQQSSTFVKALLHTSLNYDQLRMKRPNLRLTSPLKCEKHPFFSGLSNTQKTLNPFLMNSLPMKEIYSVNMGWTGLCYERSLSKGFLGSIRFLIFLQRFFQRLDKI